MRRGTLASEKDSEEEGRRVRLDLMMRGEVMLREEPER